MVCPEQANFTRSDLKSATRVVVKVGSALLTGPRADLAFERLAAQMATLSQSGTHVVLVSSGAIAQGLSVLGLERRPSGLVEQQALAAAGQPRLMRRWADAFDAHDLPVAQVLVTHSDLADRGRFINARQAMMHLERCGIITIANENDTVATDEIRVGDNDNLAAHIASLIDADLLILLTNVDGLYDANPETHTHAERISVVSTIRDVTHMAGKAGGSGLGVGGMQTKVEAAAAATSRGIPVLIAHGEHPAVLTELMAGEDVGTLFEPGERMGSRKHWIGYTLRAAGTIHIDDGAVKALTTGGKSLLPSGIVEVHGEFERGAMIEIHGPNGCMARGLAGYSAEDLRTIQGCSTHSILETLGYIHAPEAVHRDDMTLVD